MNKSLLIIPLLFISCEKEVIEPAKYFTQLSSGKPATVIKKKPYKLATVIKKKPYKLRIRKRKRRYEKINKTTISVSSGLYKHSSSCCVGSGDTSI
jgi:hypothetical protein